ncbi:hypothetical protein [uncultured Tenacibaculum sp.]|uniref:hypothetical protein n=1 Tax=uncultured Tenacibaculum sp. TaxID=174713 RepID=UPI0026274A8C|nr:hypothetical protein [uncultured Tenacibaculum sp.]
MKTKLFFCLIFLMSIYNVNAQSVIKGKYKTDYIGDNYESYEFFKNRTFTFSMGSDLGVYSKGTGSYEIKNDSLYLKFNSTKLKENSYFKSKSYYNSKNLVRVDFNVVNHEEKPLKKVMIYSLNGKSQTTETDQKGEATLVFKKGSFNDKAEVFIEGEFLDRQIIYLSLDRNYMIKAFMSSSEIIGFNHLKAIKNETKIFKIEKIGNDVIELKKDKIKARLMKVEN